MKKGLIGLTSSKQWVIMGSYSDCEAGLICALPFGYTDEQATTVLNRMVYHPTDADRLMIGEAENLWLEEVDIKDAWWNDNCD